MRVTRSGLLKWLSFLLAMLTFACIFFGWLEVSPPLREGLSARYADGKSVRGLFELLLDAFGVDMGAMDVNIFVRYSGAIAKELRDFRLSPLELSFTVGNVVKIYKLMQLNTGMLNFLLAINNSLLIVSAVNVLYRLLLYATLFYLFWVFARRYWGSDKDHAAYPLIGLVLLLIAAIAMMAVVNGAFLQSGDEAVLRLRFWPFLAIGLYTGSMVSWKKSLAAGKPRRAEGAASKK